MSDILSIPRYWRAPMGALVLLLLGIVLSHRSTALDMVDIWWSRDTYTHGFVVPLISLWLVWRIRHALAALVPKPSPTAWLLMVGAAALWLLGDLVAVNAAAHFALVSMLVIAVPAVLGLEIAWAMAFPLGFLFFAVPMGDFMLPQLMEWTADFTVFALRWSGIPIYREGMFFIIPSGSWSVVEGCSGIRYLIASVTVGCLFSYLSYESLYKRLLFIVVSIAVPLVANWLRAYMIVMIGHLSGNELATGVDHILYGWVFFGVVILVMLLIGARWVDLPHSGSGWSDAPNSIRPVAVGDEASVAELSWRTGMAAFLMLVIVASPLQVERMLARGIRQGPISVVAVQETPTWKVMASLPSDWEPSFAGATSSSRIGFSNPAGQSVGLHVSYYRHQDQAHKLVSSENVLVHSKDDTWALVMQEPVGFAIAGDKLHAPASSLRRKEGGLFGVAQRIQVWRFYWVNGRFVAGDAMAKLHEAWGRFAGQGDDGAIVTIHTVLDARLPDPAARVEANALLTDFLAVQGGPLATALQQTRGRD